MWKKLDNGIEIRGWTITSNVGPIATQGERETYEGEASLPDLPEMFFVHNNLTFEHNSGFSVSFTTKDALKCVSHVAPTFEVQTAKVWKQGNSARLVELQAYVSKQQPFDWTYTPEYKGTLVSASVEETTEGINLAKLQEPDPILYYTELTLFEDELADNGSSMLSLKMRVMPSCAFCLMRFFLRVDGVLFRMYDTRYYLEFHKNYFIREWTHKELPYESVIEKLGEDKFSQVTDAQAVGEVLELKNKILEKISVV